MKRVIKLFLKCILSLIPQRVLILFSFFVWSKWRGKFSAVVLTVATHRFTRKRTKIACAKIQVFERTDIKKDFISVIIPTYNREESLQRLLESLSLQNFNPSHFEIIVINNGSTDATHEICTRFSLMPMHLKEIFEPTPGLLAARNRGVKESCGDILTFCDDDIEPDSEWLQAIYSIMSSRPDVMLLGGNNRGGFEISPPKFVSDLWTTDSYGIRVNWHYSLVEGIEQGMVAPNHGYVMGCNFTVRREVVEKTRGFGPDCMASILWQGDGENRVGEMAQSMGTVWLDPRVSVTHHMPKSRINQDYLKKRNLYFLISHLYTCLRSGEMPPYQSAEAQAYLTAVVKIPDLWNWLTKPDYWNAELPPSVELPQIKKLLQRHGW